MALKFITRVVPVMALASIMLILFSGCEATQVGNYKGTGVNSGLSNLPQARHEALRAAPDHPRDARPVPPRDRVS